ncbi:MAG: class I SAM-dependent methyltransferase [Candidatus Pacebacteria bacterium]|nr:class I SAM-dependent methyltransferase [Candidatus Paceibacterota bacterium]
MIAIRPLFRHYLAEKFIKKHLLVKSKIVDIGCGQGDFDFQMAEKGYGVECFEFSGEAADVFKETKVRKNLPNIQLHETNFFDYPQNPNADAIVSFEVLEHIEEDFKALKKMNSWLKENGYLIISIPAHQKMWGYGDIVAGHKRRYEKKELKELLEQAGFSVIQLYSPGFPWLNVLQVIRNFYFKITNPHISGNDESRTKKSSVIIKLPSFVKLFFNPITLYPFIMISNLFNNFDLSEGYFVAAQKSKDAQ